ncbi:MAG TPA: ATP-binding protein [Telluria sp.]|nr:ATP-binding protein [Telluria sp.]
MATLVDDLLDVSRVTRGLIKIRLEYLDLRRVIDDAVEQVAPQIEARHHRLALPEWPHPVPVRADKKRLVQVISNLLTNAVKYTPEHGQISLNMELGSDQVALTVADDGIDIAPEFVPHVFDLFAQAERPADRSSGGLGLGLALVKSLVGLHGGKVSCTSDGFGKGSRFTFTLPLYARDGARVERRRNPRTKLASDRQLKILVVDDNVDAAQMLSALLEAAAHHTMTEHDPARALELARAEPPDVCLLDIGLPDIDGNELARRLREQPETSRMQLIALTGYCQAHDREEALAAGFDHYMTKPVDIGSLQAVLGAAPAR